MTSADHESPAPVATPRPLSGWNGDWIAHPASVVQTRQLPAGASITVVKRAPDGSEAARYPAIVRANNPGTHWLEVEARWTNRAVTISGLTFQTGDLLREFFSPIDPFNAFAVASADGTHKGWYGNVTYPAFLVGDATVPVLVWHDLYLDVVVREDGSVQMLDDDELDAAPAPFSEPAMHRAIHAARRDLLAFIQALASRK